VAQVVECQLSKCEVLNSNSSTAKKKVAKNVVCRVDLPYLDPSLVTH
jgi:hypothetical protein